MLTISFGSLLLVRHWIALSLPIALEVILDEHVHRVAQ